MGVTRGDMMFLQVEVTVLCRVDPRHTLGTAIMHLPPHPYAGKVAAGKGLVPDAHGKVTADCRSCAVTGRGKDQRVSLDRIRARCVELAQKGEHAGKLTA